MPGRRSIGTLAAALCLLAAVAGGARAAAPVDSIVAVVGDVVVLASELDQAVDVMRVASADSMQSDSALRAAALQRMIDDLVLQEQAQRETIDVAAADVAAEVDASMNAVRERFGGPEKLQAALDAEGLTERALRARYEEEARRKLLSRRLMEKEGLTQIYISPGEAQRFYDQNRDSIAKVPGRVTLAHILIAFQPGPSAESLGQRRMAEVLDVLARGGDFATVAGSFSDDKPTAARGGDHGWVSLTQVQPEMAMVIAQLKTGQISPPFRTRDGYVTVRLDGQNGDRVRFRSILIRVPISRADSARARSTAESVRRRALAGTPFDSLARRYSQDPTTADSGGYLGEFLTAGLTRPFDKVVAGLDSGQVSEPVESEHGYHLVKVLAKQPERELSYLDMQDGIRNYLYEQKLARRLADYTARVSSRVYVRRFQ